MYRVSRVLVLVFVVLFMLALPALMIAQDDITPTAEVTVAPPVETPAPIPAPPPVVLQPGEIAVNLSTILLSLAVSFAAGAGLLGFLSRARSDKPMLDAIERLASSMPVEALDKLLEFSKVLQETGKLLEAVTDRKENLPAPPA